MRLPVLCLVLAACVSTSEHQSVVTERDVLKGRVLALETERSDLERELKLAKREVDALSGAAKVREDRKAKALELKTSLGMDEDAPLGAILRTTAGDIRCELWPEIAPVTVENFVGLATGTKVWTDPVSKAQRTDPLYNGTVFHRVIKDFMIQGGDPLGTGRGGPGYKFEDETDPLITFREKGLLAMANSGPGTNGSQFFITDSTPTHLDGKHTIFGKCEMPVVEAIISAPVKGGGRGASEPVDPVVLTSVEITKG